jgi:penicillin-binding protein 2
VRQACAAARAEQSDLDQPRWSSVTEGNSRVRLGVVGIVVVALFGGLFARLWFLQVADSSSYAAETRANRIRVITEPAIRGSILDRNGKVIVENELVDSLQVRRGLTKGQRAVMVPRLAKVLGLTEHQVNARLDTVQFSPYQPVPIVDRVTYEKAVFIKERPELFPNVDVVRRSIRVYPNRVDEATPLGAHLLGYVGAVNAKEQKLHVGEGYGPEDVIGKDGVEQVFETELRGRPRVRKLEVDSRGRLVRVLSDKAAVAGNDVVLSMDLDAQRVAEESLAQGMKAAGGLRDPGVKNKFKTFSAKGGAAVVLDATDGSVVALASAPTFDVTKFSDGIPVEEFKALNDPSSNFPLLDRAVQGQYAPGSAFKTFTAVAALDDAIVKPDDVIIDRGFIKFGEPGKEQEFKNAGKEVHGAVTLPTAISVSSDVYFFTMGFRFWNKFNKGDKKIGYGIQHVAREFGFGRATGIGLPNELKGRVPDGKFKLALNKHSTDQTLKSWLPGDSAALAVGQGDLLVTPVQLATAYAAFANGGTVYAPRLADQILSPGQASILRKLPPQQVGKVKLNPTTRAQILPGLEGVVQGIGTAAQAFAGYSGPPVAGKTGTAEVFGKQDTSVFVGIVNPDPPPDSGQHQYVVAVFVEEGGNGGSVAAPIAKRIMLTLNGDPNPPAVKVIPTKSGHRD